MSHAQSWRNHKNYCLSVMDKFDNNYKQFENIEGFKKIRNSFKRNSNKIIRLKRTRWIDKHKAINKYERHIERRILRFVNEHNTNFDLDDVEAFNEPNIFEQLKCIKINEPNDLNGFYQFIIKKDIPTDGAKHLSEAQQPKFIDNNEPIEEFIFKCESEKQIKKDLKKFLKHIKFPSKVLIRFKGVVETPVEGSKNTNSSADD